MTTTTILVVDDERPLVDLVSSYARREGFEVVTAGDGLVAVDLARECAPDVIVLDVMLPGVDGIEVCRRVRQFSDAYIVMLTARAEEIDKIIGLTVGADDYLTKPFSPRELMARIHALLRRPRSASRTGTQAPQRLMDLVIDRERHEVMKRGEPVALTAREFALLSLLAEQPGRVFSRSQLLESVWGSAAYDDHVVEVHVGNVRRKLEDDPLRPVYVQTVRGVGYRSVSGARP